MGAILSKIRGKVGQANASEKKKGINLDEHPILKTLTSQRKVEAMLRESDLKSQLMKGVFSKDIQKVLGELDQIKSEGDQKKYEHDLTLAFWFSIHIENLEMSKQLIDREFLLKQLVACALIQKQVLENEESEEESEGNNWNDEGPQDDNQSGEQESQNLTEEEKEKDDQNHLQLEGGESDDEMMDEDKKEDDEPTLTLKPPAYGHSELAAALKKAQQMKEEQRKLEEEKQSAETLAAIGIDEETINRTQLKDQAELLRVKTSFRAKFHNLMTNVLKISLQKEEEKLACIIIAYYEVVLEEEMIIRAITQNNYEFLQFTWAFDKNYIGIRNKNDAMFIHYEQLFDLIKKNRFVEKDLGPRAEQVALYRDDFRKVLEWKIISLDNILKALLIHHEDELAVEYMGYYSHFLDKELFIHCMRNGNTEFLQQALLLAAFDKMIFREDSVITEILEILSQGHRTNFLMNVLTLVDISVWKNKHLKELVEIISDYVEENYDKNRLLLSPNPLQSITLAAELLKKVANSRRKFENECNKIQNQLLELGKMYSSKIEDEKYYESLIMGVDFRGRTVLKTITQNTFEPLMDEEDPKAENLMVMIWHGNDATKCDGNIFGYSNLSHIIMTRAKKQSGKNQTLMSMITNSYNANFKVDYSFQYTYRSQAISFYFYKEFFCALAMLVIFQYINYQYLILFSNNYINSDDTADSATPTTETSINRIIRSVREYVDWNFFALFFSCALIFQMILKILFNICARQRIGVDKWTIMDSLSAILNIAAVQVIQRVPPETYLKPKMKDLIDYFMILVLCVCWLRFFVYFLVVRSISKLLLTLLAMIGDTLSFMFIVCCFILIMASVFTTLYQDTNPEKYGGLALTVRTLFDAAIGQYDYENMEGRELSHSILLIGHVFFSNILLMNYLIAILSTTYENMKQSGIFRYKVNLYKYCERFMIAFADRDYGEIVLHPPPVSYLSAMMIPFLVSRKAMMYISKGFSYMMYWLENIFFVMAFAGFELAILPIAYIKVWINIIKNSMGVLNTIVNCLVWLLIGIFMMIFLLFRDVLNLLIILSYHNGCKKASAQAVEDLNIEDNKIKVYNETRATVISLYQRLQKHMRQEQIDDNDEDMDFDDDIFPIKDDENMNEDFLYVVKKSLIIDEWKKRRTNSVKQKKIQEKLAGNKSSALGNLMAVSFRKQLQRQASGLNVKNSKQGALPNEKDSLWGGLRGSQNMKANQQNRPKDLTNHLRVVFLDRLKNSAVNQNDGDDVDMSDFAIEESEIQLVDEFLTKFTIVSESSMNEHLDIMLMLKALPNKVMRNSLKQTDLFNFRIFQESLIAYQNLDIVNAFEYFDDKNRERVQNVKDKLMNQRTNLNDVKDILDLVKIKIERNEQYFQQQKGMTSPANGESAPKITSGNLK